MSIDATYVDVDTFTIVGDQTLIFHEGRRVRADCAGDGIKYGTISAVAFGAVTTVDLTAASDDLTANLDTVKFGIVGKGVTQSMPDHLHSTGEGAGGEITGTAREYSASQNFDEAVITSVVDATSSDLAWNLQTSQTAIHTLTDNTTVSNPSNMKAGGTYVLRIIQAAGVYSIDWDTSYIWGSQDPPAAPAANGDVIILTFYSDGSNMYGAEFMREEA